MSRRLGIPFSLSKRRTGSSSFARIDSWRQEMLPRKRTRLFGELPAPRYPLKYIDQLSDSLIAFRYIPLNVLSTDASGKASIDRKTVLEGREITVPVDMSKPFKLNAGTSGVCTFYFFSCLFFIAADSTPSCVLTDRVAYTPERLKQLGEWAAKKDSVFTLEDRMGLVSDAVVLAKAGLGKTSAAFDLVETFSNETESEYLSLLQISFWARC